MKSEFKTNSIKDWIEYRLPIFSFIDHSLGSKYPAPRNLNYWWNFGSIAGIVLVMQIVTGLFLAMHYTANSSMAFDSVENIMRNVNYGWLLRYAHAVGASMFFVVVYIHIFRGLYYGSYKAPRELLWWLGIVILLLMMATAFMGYVLPWGQMSFWGATVITNLFSAIPGVGQDIVHWLWGGFSVDNPTLNRFYALHFLLPFVIVGVVIFHIWALHIHGSNNPLGLDVQSPQDVIPFHPYYTMKDFFGFGIFFILFSWLVFFYPNSLGDADNYIPANPMVTPAHIVPEWYFLPFYAILRSMPDIGVPFTNIVFVQSKLAGVIGMFSSILIFFFLPWLDRSKVRSATFRPIYKCMFWLFLFDCIVLGYIGSQPPEGAYLTIGRIALLWYFAHFVILWFVSKHEKTLRLPESISKSVISNQKPETRNHIFCLLLASGFWLLASGVSFAENQKPPRKVDWAFDGIFGHVDKQAAQRGFQVYKEVCSACHSLNRIAFRNLQEIGFSEAEVKVLAASYQITDGPNDQGEMFQRPGKPSDTFPLVYANDNAARAVQHGAVPPDLSLIIKARHDGANYVYSLLTGFSPAPPEVQMGEGQNYNPYFPDGRLMMPPPLSEGQVTYADGTPATVDQMSRDVVTFLEWAAEPEMEARKEMGLKVLIYLAVLTAFMYIAKRNIWRKLH